MTVRPRILFVCFADSMHSQSWMDLLRGSEFDVRVFASPVDFGDRYPPQPWQFPTYTPIQPSPQREANRIMWLLPRTRVLRPLVNWGQRRFHLVPCWLRWIILTWKPDIVHSLSLGMGARLTWQALRPAPKARWPRWLVSSWGSDINLGIDDPNSRGYIELVLRNCDGFIADCRRDIQHALAAGLIPDKVALEDAVPVTGGLNLDDIPRAQSGHENRNLILVPKAYEGSVNKTLPILEALRLAEDALAGYEVHLLMCSKDVQMWLRKMPESLQQRCDCHATLPHSELIAMLGRARVMIATSLSDGTPNVMLEAMAVGVLPLMSPLESIQEWIEDGRNGLLAHALYPDQIAAALRRALADDELCDRAAVINRQIVEQRANRARIRPQVLDCYRNLLRL